MSARRVFVTGGSGFVGGHLIEALVAAGHRVRAMARSDESASLVQRFGAEPVRCSLSDVSRSDIADSDSIIHAAAKVDGYGERQDFVAANVTGTHRLLGAARRAGARRFVLVSTEAVLFDGSDLVQVDETHPYPSRHRFHYSETKAMAERAVRAAHSPDFETVSIRPRFVWGPRDHTLLPQMVRAAESGSFVWLSEGAKRTSTTHVANLVDALLLALTRGGGETYFVADEGTRTMRSFVDALVASAGVTLPARSIPAPLGRAMAAAAEASWRLLRRQDQPPISRLAAAMMSAEVTVRTDKAQRELGYAPRVSVEEGLAALQPSQCGSPL